MAVRLGMVLRSSVLWLQPIMLEFPRRHGCLSAAVQPAHVAAVHAKFRRTMAAGCLAMMAFMNEGCSSLQFGRESNLLTASATPKRLLRSVWCLVAEERTAPRQGSSRSEMACPTKSAEVSG